MLGLRARSPRRKYFYLYTKKTPKIRRIDLIAIGKGTTIGVEVKADLSGLSSIADQLERYLSVYDLNLLYLAVPIHLVGKAKIFISSHIRGKMIGSKYGGYLKRRAQMAESAIAAIEKYQPQIRERRDVLLKISQGEL